MTPITEKRDEAGNANTLTQDLTALYVCVFACNITTPARTNNTVNDNIMATSARATDVEDSKVKCVFRMNEKKGGNLIHFQKLLIYIHRKRYVLS